MALTEYIQQIATIGRYHFTSQEAEKALGISRKALNMALIRLRKKGMIATPAKQFHLFIPPEYTMSGCLPPEQFIPHLMKYWKLPYYVCLLSAAEYYGAAHQKPRYFQVMTTINKSDLQCGQAQVCFIKKANISETLYKTFNTVRSVVAVSTPEITAMDLINYPWQSGGLNHVATVLAELAETMDKDKLVQLAKKSKQPAWIQRLGYILTIVGHSELANGLKNTLQHKKKRVIPLNSDLPMTNYPRDHNWQIAINMKIESDI